MPPWLIEMLGLSAGATEDQAKAALTKMKGCMANEAQVTDLRGQLTTVQTELSTERGRVTELTTASTKLTTDLANERTRATTAETNLTTERAALTETKTKLTAAETSFANERKARVEGLVADGIRAGKILLAEKAQWETEFANEFTGTATKLTNAKPKLHTQSITGGLGKRSSAQLDRSSQIQEFVNERIKTNKEDYDTAFNYVRKTKPDLFSGMQDPLAPKS